jgi:hypothetical protein
VASAWAAKLDQPTAKAVAAQLTAEIAAFWSLIRDHQIYIDTAIFLVHRPVMPSIRRMLRDTNCASIAYLGSLAMQYGHRIEVQRPTEDTLIRLAELLPDHIVSGFHVAVDFTTANQENAQTLARELSLTTTLRWRGHSKTGRSFDTFYAAARKVKPTITARKTRRNLAIYTRGSITHFEARYAGAMCSGRGIRHSADLLNRDLAAMIDKDFRFSAVSWKRVDKLIEQTARNTVRQAAAHAGPCQTVAAVEQQLRTKIFGFHLTN